MMILVRHVLFALLAFCVFTSADAAAQNAPSAPIKIIRKTAPPKFRLPLLCTLGKDCWVMNYTDTGANGDNAAIDPFCNARTYEGHKGTDFAIADGAAMERGVDVLAAHDGTISRVRDGEDDLWATKEDLAKIREANKDCGNAVLIDHGNGWQTMSCHMKKNSITVKPGQPVRAGDKIGQVGLSGYTEFPHLHFGLIHDNMVVDPFTGADITKPCGQKPSSLWASPELIYNDLEFFAGGFETEIPSIAALDRARKSLDKLPARAQSFIYYTVILGVRDKDSVTLTIEDPSGKIFAQSRKIQDKDRARQMYYVGRKITTNLPHGTYTGKTTLTRKDKDGKPRDYTDTHKILVE